MPVVTTYTLTDAELKHVTGTFGSDYDLYKNVAREKSIQLNMPPQTTDDLILSTEIQTYGKSIERELPEVIDPEDTLSIVHVRNRRYRDMLLWTTEHGKTPDFTLHSFPIRQD